MNKSSFLKYARCLVLFFMMLWSSLFVYSQGDNWHITRYSSLNGLSTNDVTDMKQDNNGYLWLATSNGICRYDGYNFLNFHPTDSYGLYDNHIAKLELDRKKQLLWTFSFSGNVGCFHLSLGKFIDYLQDAKAKKEFKNHQIWSHGVILYDNKSGVRVITFDGKNFQHRDFTYEKGTLPSKRILSIVEDSSEYFWIVTDKGVCRASVSGKMSFVGPKKKVLAAQLYKGNFYVYYEDNTIRIYSGTNLLKSIVCSRIYSMQKVVAVNFLAHHKWYIYGDVASLVFDMKSLTLSKNDLQISAIRKPYQDKEYVVVSDNKGCVYVFKNGKLKLKKNLFEQVSPAITFNYRVWVSQHLDGCLYIATAGNGLFVYNPKTNSIEPVSISSDNTVMPSKLLGGLFCDKDGNIWTSLEYAGLYKIYHSSICTKLILPLPHTAGDRANNIRLLHSVGNGKVLVSTKDKMVFLYDESDNSIRSFKEYPANVYAYLKDRKGRVWVATRGSGFWINRQHYKKKDFKLLKVGNIYDFVEDNYGRVWIATFGDGLLLATTSSKGKVTFSKYLSDGQGESDIRDLLIDSNGWLWIATNKGFFVIDAKKKKISKKDFINYSKQNGSFRDEEVISLFQDSKSNIWIGSYGKGVAFTKLPRDYKRIKFNWITKQNGLLNNNVRSILEDRKGNVWIASDEGINCLNKFNEYMDNYVDPNHILNNIYSENSAIVLSDGDLLYGTTQGLVRIKYREQTYKNNKQLIPRIVDMDVNGETIFRSSRDWVKCLLAGEKILLQPNENTVTFYFSNLNFSKKMLYRFYLEGIDKKWESQSVANSATYKNLSPGVYRFHVETLVGINKWSPEQVLTIEVAHPWWSLWWIKALFLLLIFTIIALLSRMLYNNFKLREKIKVERQFMEFRLNFFSQMAHEFRTPLAIIKSAMDCLKDANTLYDAKASIKVANRGSDRLAKLVNNLLLFRKVNTGDIKLNVELYDIIADLRQLYLDFRPMAEVKGQEMLFVPFERKYQMLYDREKIETIVYNLLSNAIKYSTTPKGVIELRVECDAKQELLSIFIKDSGMGLTEEQEKTLFQPYMHGNVSQGGMGLGLYMSKQLAVLHHAELTYHKPEEGQIGATFVLTLPNSLGAYAKEEYKSGITGSLKKQTTESPLFQNTVGVALNMETIFVVEDDPDLLVQIKQILSVYFKVVGYSNGKEAFEQICKQKPALVISDVMLPEMDGFCLSRSIKSNAELAHVKVILLTALDGEENRLKGIQAAADDYFVKPCSVQLLVARCFKLIEQKHKQKCSLTSSEDKEEVKERRLITSPVDKVFMEKVTTIVYAHLSEADFSVDQLCDLLGVGRTTTFNRIKELFGMTPNEYIREERLQTAAKMLLEGDKNIAEISLCVGFSDPSYFNRRFKARFGVAPSKYGR